MASKIDDNMDGQEGTIEKLETQRDVTTSNTGTNRDTVEDPPDGGTQAWLIVLACAVINACNMVIYFLFLSTITLYGRQPIYRDTNVYEGTQVFGVSLAAVLSIRFGYRLVAGIGGCFIGVGFFVASLLNPEHESIFHVMVGLAGIGSSFWILATKVAVLEYFQKKRMRAIILAGVGSVIGMFGGYGIMVYIAKHRFSSSDWPIFYRWTLLPVVIGTFVACTLFPLKIVVPDRKQTCLQRFFGLHDWSLMKFTALWLVLSVYFCYHLGKPIPGKSISYLLNSKGYSMGIILACTVVTSVGSLLGYVLLLCWRRRKLRKTMRFMGISCLLIGTLSLQVPAFPPDMYGWVIVYLLMYGVAITVFEAVLQDIVPTAFGRQNIRLVEGLLGFANGVGSMLSTVIAENMLKYPGGYDNQFYFAGAALLGSGLLAYASLTSLRKSLYNESDKHKDPEAEAEDPTAGMKEEEDKVEEFPLADIKSSDSGTHIREMEDDKVESE